MSIFSRRMVRVGATLTATGVFVLAGASVASAHVTAHSPDQLARGGFAEISFRVPNEQANANTTKLQVTFPDTTPLAFVDVRPAPGWTADVQKATLAKPINLGKETVTTAVRTITWTANPGTPGITPGQFDEFFLEVGPLPNTDTLVMPAVQTYDNGTVVRWVDRAGAGPEPAHPAPTLAIGAASASDTGMVSAGAVAAPPATGSGGDGTARWLGGAGLVVGALGLGMGLGAFLRGRRSPATSTEKVVTSA